MIFSSLFLLFFFLNKLVQRRLKFNLLTFFSEKKICYHVSGYHGIFHQWGNICQRTGNMYTIMIIENISNGHMNKLQKLLLLKHIFNSNIFHLNSIHYYCQCVSGRCLCYGLQYKSAVCVKKPLIPTLFFKCKYYNFPRIAVLSFKFYNEEHNALQKFSYTDQSHKVTSPSNI